MSSIAPAPARAGVVFLAVGDGYQARSLLRSGVFATLKEHVDKLVVLAPNPDEEYLRRELQAPNVVVEDLQVDGATAYMGRNRVQNVLRRVRNYALEVKGARALNDKAWWRMPRGGGRWWVKGGTNALIWTCQHSALTRRGLVAAENALMPAGFFAPLFERYGPGLVVTAAPGYLPHDTLLLREARRRGIQTVCVITSWDAPHNMGLRGARPDYVVVWREVQKREVVRYQGFRPERVVVGGMPAFDVYRNTHHWPSREDLFARYGLDPQRKLIMFATKSPAVYLHIRIMEALVKAIGDGRFSYPAQLLARLHPLHFTSFLANSPALQSIMAEYQALAAQTSYLAFSIPQVVSTKMDNDMPGEARELACLLHHTDVLINLFSTIQLEACLADVPVINVAFDPPRGELPDGNTLLPSQARQGYRLRPIAVDVGQPQGQRVVASRATRQAHSIEELIALTNRYLQEPALEADERRRLAEEECGPTDGHAGERVGQFLLGLLGTPKRSSVAVAPE